MKPAPLGWGNVPTRIEPAAGALDEPAAEELPELLPDISDLNGRQIGNYVIEGPLGRGGMAVVYLAKHPGLGREVAVKVLSPEYQGDADLNRRFLQEARVTATFRHPHIIEIYDLGEVEGRAYYTMERLIGVDLAAQMLKQGRFTPREVSAYMLQICSALDAAHRVGVVHRDLKPANIFVVNEQPLRLKLMDFGIAKLTEGRKQTGTRRGEVLGTPAYMAPEQALGQVDAITAATDIYALGIIAYEMLTGQLPFYSDSDVMLLSMHVRDTPPPLQALLPTLPRALAALVERCLAKDPGTRPRSASEFAVEFERLSQSVPPEPAAAPLEAPSARRADAASRVEAAAAPARRVVPEARARVDAPAAPARAAEPAEAQPKPKPKPAAAQPAAASALGAKGTPAAAERVVQAKVGAAAKLPAPLMPGGASGSRTGLPALHPSVMRQAVVPAARSNDELGVPSGPVTLSLEDGKLLDKLLKRMQRRADFPAFLNNVAEISRKSDADADYSAWQLSESILKDFALTAKLLRMVNSLFGNRFGGRVFSIKQAVIILGFDSVRSMALGASVFKQAVKGERYQEELADESINSLISGEIARVLAPEAGVVDKELALMCAMFRNLGQHLVMEYLPEEYQKIVELAKSERITRAQAAPRVLGLPFSKVGVGVAERWALPKLMRGAMSSNPQPGSPLVREEDRLGALAKLSNELCQIVATGERQSYKASVARLLAKHQNLLSLSEPDITSLLGVVCKSFETRYSALFGPYHRKSRFLLNARNISGEPLPVEHREVEPLTDAERERLDELVEELNEGLANNQLPDALLMDAIKSLSRTLQAPRVVLLTTTGDRKELEVRAALGEAAAALKTQFRLPVVHGSDVFSSALRTGKSVVVADTLGPAYMRRLPQRYFEAIGSTSFGLYVCASRGYPTALLLVDADSATDLPTSERVLATKDLREVVAKIAERR
jgi:HD-like signal output (HDOD) protein